jgi:Sap-like sulfolipid-1-addressing protein
VGEHFGIVVPLALGAAISPTTLALQLFVLSRKTAPLARAWAIAAGYAVVLLAMMAIAFAFAASTGSGSQSKPEAWLKLACAVGLAALGVLALRRPPKQRKQEPEGGDPKLGRFFAIGVALMATNLTTAALYLPAMHDVGDAGASAAGVALAALVVIAITLFPAVAPPLAVTLLGDRAVAALDALSAFCARHSRAINASVCFGFAIFLAAVSLPVVL